MAETLELEASLARFPCVLFDTCVLIDEFQGPSALLSRIRRAQRRTSVIALWEFLHGTQGAVLARATRRQRLEWLDNHGIAQVHLHSNCSLGFRSLMVLDTSPPTAADCLIAAEAIARGWPLLTRNWKDFESVRGLRVIRVAS